MPAQFIKFYKNAFEILQYSKGHGDYSWQLKQIIK